MALAAVLGIIAILAGIARLMTRHRADANLRADMGSSGRSPAGLLEVIGRYPIARGATLVLLRLERRILLLSMTSGLRGGSSFSTLCEISDPEEVAAILTHARDATGESMNQRFRAMLDRSDDRLQAAEAPVQARPAAAAPSPNRRAATTQAAGLANAQPLLNTPSINSAAASALLSRLSSLTGASKPGTDRPARPGSGGTRLRDISA